MPQPWASTPWRWADEALSLGFFVGRCIPDSCRSEAARPCAAQPKFSTLISGCVWQVYTPWNMHEPYPGQYVWSGMADLERWMDLIQARRAWHVCMHCACGAQPPSPLRALSPLLGHALLLRTGLLSTALAMTQYVDPMPLPLLFCCAGGGAQGAAAAWAM